MLIPESGNNDGRPDAVPYYPQVGVGAAPPQQPQQQAYGNYDYGYTTPPRIESGKKDIPLGTVVAVGVLVWFLIFTSLFGYAALNPCGFVQASMSMGGGATLINSMNKCCEMTNSTVCKDVIRSMVFGESPACVNTCAIPPKP